MAKIPANSIRAYLNEHNISGSLTSTQAKVAVATPTATAFLDDGPRRVVAGYDHSHSELALFDGDDDAFDEQLAALLADDDGTHYLTKVFGKVEGSVAYDYPVRISAAPLEAQAGNVIMRNFEAAGDGELSRGLCLAMATVTGAGNRTGRNMGATSSGERFRVVFRLVEFDGTNITLKLQESGDDGDADAYADISGLTSGALTGPDCVVVETTDATEAYKRVNIAGTFTSAVIVVTAGVVKVLS